MKRLPATIFALCLLVFAASPALAEFSVSIINRTDFEIQSVGMVSDSGSMTASFRVVPGNSCSLTDGNATELKSLSIDAGLMFFSFADMQGLDGKSSVEFELTYDANQRAHLTLVESTAPAGSEGFDLEAGPIWSNDHAGQRCPQVLEEWLAANPDKKAEWTGAWLTTKQGEMSVCGMKRTDGGAEAAVPSLLNFVGGVTAFADPMQPSTVQLSDITGAGNMDELQDMGGKPSPLSSGQVYLPASFAGKTWAVLVDADNDAPGVCSLRTYTAGSGPKPVLDALAAMNYRPLFSQYTTGKNMDTTSMTSFWKEYDTARAAWSRVAALAEAAHSGASPAAVDVLLLQEEDYAKVNDGETGEVPGFRLRVSNADVITLIFMPDMSGLVSLVR